MASFTFEPNPDREGPAQTRGDRYMHGGPPIPAGKIAKWGLSSTVVLLMAAAWVAWLAGTESAWMMLGLTACATSAAAAVAFVRCYAVAICRLVRVNADRIAELEPLGPHSIR